MDKLKGFSQIHKEEIYTTITTTTAPTQQTFTKPVILPIDTSIKHVVAKVIESSDDGSDSDDLDSDDSVNKHNKQYIDVKNLKYPIAPPKVTPIATSPEEFLEALGLKQDPKNLFTQEDVVQIYDMIREYPMSSEVTIHTLFEMQTFDLLSSIKDMKLLLDSEDIETYLNQYHVSNLTFFLKYLESDTLEFDFIYIDEYTAALKKMLIENLRYEKSDFEKTQTKYNLCKKEYTNKVLPFFNKWEKNINLLKKIVSYTRLDPSSDTPKHSIIFKNIGDIPGARTIIKSSSLKCMQNAIKNLSKYINNKTETVRLLSKNLDQRKKYGRCVQGITSSQCLSMFENMNQVIFGHFQDTKNQCDTLLKLVAKNLFDLGVYYDKYSINDDEKNQKPHKSKPIPDDITFDFLKCYRYWVYQMYSVFDNSILPVICSKYQTLKVHEGRFHITLRKFNSNFELKYSDMAQNNPEWFNNIYREFYKKIQSISSDLKAIEKTSYKCMEYTVRTYDFITDKIKQLYQKLKPIAESTLIELLKYAKEHPNAVCKLQLTDMTIMLAKALIMVGDLHMVINEEKLWLQDLPEEYLEFISMQNDTETESDMCSEETPHELLQEEQSPKVTPSKPVESAPFEDLDSAFLHFNLEDLSEENKVPPQCLHSGLMALQDKVVRSSSKLAHKSVKPKVQKRTSSAEPRPTHTEKYISLRHIKSAKKLQEVLSKIGLVSVPGKGSHTKWLYPESQTVATIVPNHDKDLGAGLRRALERQVNNNRPKEESENKNSSQRRQVVKKKD